VGHFNIGERPRQNAQFSIPYCVANALLRKCSQFQNFEEASIRDPKIMEIIRKITVIPDPEMEKRDETSMDMEVRTKEGAIFHKSLDTPRGFPEDPMTREELIARFRQCLRYKNKSWQEDNIQKIASMVYRLEELSDIRSLIFLIADHNS
jgi:2-methylcitrate dehydratase PrpD